MAMNKMEKAEMDLLKIKAALHLSTGETPQPDIKPSVMDLGYKEVVKGFSLNSQDVMYACSSGSGHNTSHTPCHETRSQKAIDMYSSKVEAAKALRFKKELEYAKDLYRIDCLIEKYIKEEQGETV